MMIQFLAHFFLKSNFVLHPIHIEKFEIPFYYQHDGS
jgi:hypothetical protein